MGRMNAPGDGECPLGQKPRFDLAATASAHSCQPAIDFRVCAKQTLANGFFNERQRFLGLSRLGLGNFGPKLYSRQLVLLRFNTRLGLF